VRSLSEAACYEIFSPIELFFFLIRTVQHMWWHNSTALCYNSEGSDSIVTKTPGDDIIDNPLNKDVNHITDSTISEKPALDLNDGDEVSDELDDQLFGQFADVMSKVSS
jgi:hypothetical protein